jgi:hypothetical protein
MYRNRKHATAYLRQRGIPCGDAFLAHQAVTGEGPLFRYSGRHPVYTEEDLDAWIESRLSAPVRSPSEAAAAPSSESEEQVSNPPLGPPTRTARHRAAAPATHEQNPKTDPT